MKIPSQIEVEDITDLISENILQVDNRSELWEGEYTLKDIKKYDYVMECDTGMLYRIKK
jgi:hypothetical protein